MTRVHNHLGMVWGGKRAAKEEKLVHGAELGSGWAELGWCQTIQLDGSRLSPTLSLLDGIVTLPRVTRSKTRSAFPFFCIFSLLNTPAIQNSQIPSACRQLQPHLLLEPQSRPIYFDLRNDSFLPGHIHFVDLNRPHNGIGLAQLTCQPARTSYASHILACPGTPTSNKSIPTVLPSMTSVNRCTTSPTCKPRTNISSTKSSIVPISPMRLTPGSAAVRRCTPLGPCGWVFWVTSVCLKVGEECAWSVG